MANKVFLMGRLCKDPEMRDGETKVARYSLAVDRKYSKGEDKQTDFINIVAFGKSAEFAEKYFKKGMKVLITGRIQTGSYTNKDGQKVNTFDVVAEDQEFAESKSANTDKPESKDEGFMELSPDDLKNLPF